MNVRPDMTDSQRSGWSGLKLLGAVALVLAVLALLIVTSCSKTPSTFTPAVSAPSIADADVQADAQRWANAAPGRFWMLVSDTHSMEPYFTSKSIPLMVPYTGQPIPNGTVVDFNRGDLLHVLHVVSDQTADQVYMSGVNNHSSDGWFPRSKINGVVVGQLYRP